ncbi:unnamed protein product [Eruca vesicaria subsp. sativa]|uniref:Uncharacterized protein n=1 Tax=Eruca vesicaria subsp. sativa TaxID=29727 RepID=A0ABC8KDW6_ERUVS|nr:unnamed protein product [Eruca vesicaria subsp. sativa]
MGLQEQQPTITKLALNLTSHGELYLRHRSHGDRVKLTHVVNLQQHQSIISTSPKLSYLYIVFFNLELPPESNGKASASFSYYISWSTSSLHMPSPYKIFDIYQKERARIQELIQRKGTQYGSCPRFNVTVRSQKAKVSDGTGGLDMILRSWDYPVAWQITLRSVGKKKEPLASEDDADEDLCVLSKWKLSS